MREYKGKESQQLKILLKEKIEESRKQGVQQIDLKAISLQAEKASQCSKVGEED
jgi:hypothetical protein